MERKSIPEAENRLLILYAISHLQPATGMQLLEFMTEFDLMNYFTLQLGLAEMEEQGQIAGKAHPLGRLLSITRSGEYALNSFEGRIPISRRELIDAHAPVWRHRFRLEQQTPSDIKTLPDGRREIKMRLMEKDTVLLEIVLLRSAGETVKRVQEKWRGMAQRVYKAVNMTLLSDYHEGATPPKELPQDATLEHASMGEWKLRLQCENMMLTLCLPDERLALWCASIEREKCLALKKQIDDWLDEPLS